MEWQESTAQELLQQVNRMLSQMEQLSRTTILWMAVAAVLLAGLGVCVFLLVKIRSRNRKVETWLVKEMAKVHDAQEEIYQLIAPPPPPVPQAPARQAPLPRAPQHQPPEHVTEPAVPVYEAPPLPTNAQPIPPQELPANLSPILNEILAGDQPYNFVESVRAIDPRLNLQRLTPHTNGDVFAKEILLELGGDGLFAWVQDGQAQLYPNYSRFSTTLDPKPLFDGARHGARIHSVIQPALLRAQADGKWLLVEKGRVQMRQGK